MISRHDEPRYAEALKHLGESGSRRLIATPALVCELDLLDQNISRMAELTTAARVALRPHAKTHKTSFVARRQLDAGAVGISCAKVSEAEAIVVDLLSEGRERPSVLVTSPVVGASVATRAASLARRCDLLVVVDALAGVDELDHAVGSLESRLTVLCDVDVGLSRTGVTDPDQALRIVERIEASPRLRFGGVQGYAGHVQHVAGREERRAACVASTARLEAVVVALEASGLTVEIRTGGGTGTAVLDIELGLLNELQPGSYVFMDREYRDALGDDAEGRFAQSLTIDTTVVSANHDGFVTVDAGLKAMATDAGPPAVVGLESTSTFAFFGDEHGLVTRDVAHPLSRGERIELVPPHCDPTVDRYDLIWLVRDDVVVGTADVIARGHSQ